MAKCEICEKTAIHGNKLSITRSHISKRAPRTWKPNLRTVKAEVDGEIKRAFFYYVRKKLKGHIK